LVSILLKGEKINIMRVKPALAFMYYFNLQLCGKWSCNTMEKLLATFFKKYLQKTQVSICKDLSGVDERTLFEKRKGFVLGAQYIYDEDNHRERVYQIPLKLWFLYSVSYATYRYDILKL
jgi:hypothetical protein